MIQRSCGNVQLRAAISLIETAEYPLLARISTHLASISVLYFS
ncbi:hypothetical protein LEP1GSC049_2226 [Leptospira kirschneri serovar Cynopteri str. 3522 CT]|nr:hypothetical protein LEP1GSC049_2226 [Leptospira kirschneri serovar Cynopteri str. 3522 CT]